MIAFTIPGAPQGNKSDCRRWRKQGGFVGAVVGDWQGGFPPQTEPGTARGEARARTCRNGHTYTPDNTVLYENLVKTEFLRQCGRRRLSADDRPALKPFPDSRERGDCRRVSGSGLVLEAQARGRSGRRWEVRREKARFPAPAGKAGRRPASGFSGSSGLARTFTDLSVMKRYGEQPEVRVKLWTVSEQGSEGT